MAKERIKKNKNNKLFLHLHYMDIHEPFLPPSKFLKEVRGQGYNILDIIRETFIMKRIMEKPGEFSELSKEKKELIKDLYNASVKYTDSKLGDLLDFLNKIGLIENTLLIITADHGQGLGDHGAFIHGTLYDEEVHVPLMFWSKDFQEETISSQVRTIDISPTILDMLNVDLPDTFRGESLLPFSSEKSEDKALIASSGATWGDKINDYWCLRTPTKKYIQTYNHRTQELEEEELYDLKKDPNELRNILENDPKSLKTLRGILTEISSKNYAPRKK